MAKRTRRKNTAPVQTADITDTPIYKSFSKIIHEATKTNTTHEKYIHELRRLFHNLRDHEIKLILIQMTKAHFQLGEDVPQVVCYMEFIALYLNSIEQEQQAIFNMTNQGEGEMHKLMKDMLSFCVRISDVDMPFIRRYALQFVNIILNKMGDGTLEDDLFDQLSKCMLERMQDTNSKVRVEAVHAAKRLQDPRTQDDKICQAYKFHLRCDIAHQVRKAVLECIGYSVLTSDAIILRTRDTEESIRYLAYQRLSEVLIKNISLKNRQTILYRGLKEKSSKIRNFVEDVLISHWIQQSENSVVIFLDNIRYDISETHKKQFEIMVENAINSLYKKGDVLDLCKELRLDKEHRLMPFSELKIYSIIYWRHLARCISRDPNVDLDLILPELSYLVGYMIEYSNKNSKIMDNISAEKSSLLEQMEYNYTRLEFFRMLHLYDGSDEVGRNNLKKYLLNILLNDKHLHESHIKEIIKVLKNVCITFSIWQQDLLNIINDIYQPMVATENVITPGPSVDHQKTQEFVMKKAALRVDILSLQSDKDNAIANKDFIKAQEYDNQLTAAEEELRKLHAASIIVPAEECHIEEEKREVTENPKDIMRTFMILYFMLSEFNHSLTPELEYTRQDIVHPQLQSQYLEVEYWAIKCCACFCIEDLTLAKRYFPLFFLKMFDETSEDDNKFNIANLALQVIFDLFTTYTIEDFLLGTQEDSKEEKKRRLYTINSSDPANEENTKDSANEENTNTSIQDGVEESAHIRNFIQIIIKLLQECDAHDTRLIVIQGLAKLFLNEKITSNKILGMLLLMYHHPEMDLEENNDLRQNIVTIFSGIGFGAAGGPETLIYALIPAMRILVQAPPESPLRQIQLYDVSKVVLTIISVDNIPDNRFHNLLALTICNELKRARRDEELEIVLLRTLANSIITGDEQLKIDIKNFLEQLLLRLKSKDSIKYLRQCIANIEESNNHNAATENSTDNNTITQQSNEPREL